MTLALGNGSSASDAVASIGLTARAKRATVLLAVLATGLAATGCATYTHVEEMPVSQPLPPMREPGWEVGTHWHYLRKQQVLDSGRRVWQYLESQRDDSRRLAMNTGFRVTNQDLFSPATRATDYQLPGRERRQDVPPSTSATRTGGRSLATSTSGQTCWYQTDRREHTDIK